MFYVSRLYVTLKCLVWISKAIGKAIEVISEAVGTLFNHMKDAFNWVKDKVVKGYEEVVKVLSYVYEKGEQFICFVINLKNWEYFRFANN